MPEYQTADGKWNRQRSWSTVCNKLRELHGDRDDCRGFRVRTDAANGGREQGRRSPENSGCIPAFRRWVSVAPPGTVPPERPQPRPGSRAVWEETAFNDAEAAPRRVGRQLAGLLGRLLGGPSE